jgi:hypothetical protein
MKTFERDGKEGWRYPNPWDFIANSIVGVFIARKKDLC